MQGGARARGTTLTTFAGLAILVVVLSRLAFEAGGFFPADHLAAGVAWFAGVAVLGAIALPRLRPTSHALVALGALAGFAVWSGLSAIWSPLPDEALLDFQRNLAYVGLFALALLTAGSGRYSGALVWGALAVCVVVVGAGLLSRIAPGVVDSTVPVAYRLSHPLTYWNAFGGLAAFGTALALGLGSDPREAPWARSAAAALAVPLAVAMYFSLSRGSWLALAAGVVALVVLTPYRVSALITLGLVGVAVLACVWRLEGLDGLVEDPRAGAGQRSEGADFAPFLVLATFAVAGSQLVIGQIRASPDLQYAAEAVRGRVLAAAAVVAVVGFALVYAVAGGALEGRSARVLDDATGWVDRQWDDFLMTSTFGGTGRERLVTSRGSRSDLYRVAVDGFQAHPLRGDGAGSFEWRWFQGREVQEDTREPHSLWLGTLGELGAVGALLLLAFFGSLVEGARRGLVRPTGLRRAQTAAVAAGLVVFLVHSAADWDWQMPALTGTVLLACAALLPPGRWRRAAEEQPA